MNISSVITVALSLVLGAAQTSTVVQANEGQEIMAPTKSGPMPQSKMGGWIRPIPIPGSSGAIGSPSATQLSFRGCLGSFAEVLG